MTRPAPRTRAALAAAALLLTAGATAGTADPAPTSTVTIGATSTSGSVLRVPLTVALAPLAGTQVGSDATGDGRLPGTDLVSATIVPLGGGRTAFELGVGNLLPAPVHSLPAVLHHNWEFAVQNGSSVTTLTLKAVNRGAVNASLQGGSLDAPSFALQTCSPDPQTGTNTCTSEYVDGEITSTTVRFLLSNARIGAVSGARISPTGQGINVSAGASDLAWYTNGLGGDVMGAGVYEVPEGVVRTGLAPAGTPLEDVALTDVRNAAGTSVTAQLPRPAAGSYVVVSQACHGGTCGPLASRTVSVS